MNQYYCIGKLFNTTQIVKNAQADANKGISTFLHYHPQGESCNDRCSLLTKETAP